MVFVLYALGAVAVLALLSLAVCVMAMTPAKSVDDRVPRIEAD